MFKSYRELCLLPTFEERFEYLRLRGSVGFPTFGSDRYANQMLYTCAEWRRSKRYLILRDESCDLGIPGREIFSRLTVHHINPVSIEDLELGRDCVFDPDNLICTVHNTHMAIHYSDSSLLAKLPRERRKGDTTLWTVY